MIADRITSYKDLLSQCIALPKPAEEALRVYRGQTKEYPKIVSSLGRLRQGLPAEYSRVFFEHLFVKEAALNIVGELKHLPHFTFFDLDVQAQYFYLAEALVQHYGYQTRYIDVTPSLETALWFATHRFRSHADEMVGEKAPFRLTFPAWYEPSSEEGVLYVLDVRKWKQGMAISEGEYIDLVEIAPEGVNRPRLQTGGVLYAPGLSSDHDDVSQFVQAKFTIAFPWTEAGKDWDTDYLFPSPEKDGIYSRLLHAPYLRTVRSVPNGPEETVWRRPCTIPEYYGNPADELRRQLYRTFDKKLTPTLYYPWLMRNLNELETSPSWQVTLRPQFERASPILLERPNILFSMQRGSPRPAPEQPPANVPPPFRNFFLEYSPESFGFGYDESEMSRGVWCCWIGSDEFLLQSFGTLNGKPRAADISIYHWKAGHGLVCRDGPELNGSYVTRPLDLTRLTVQGALTLLQPDERSNGFFTLTTNEKFWSAISEWTDLL
jgi:hypothetical protein